MLSAAVAVGKTTEPKKIWPKQHPTVVTWARMHNILSGLGSIKRESGRFPSSKEGLGVLSKRAYVSPKYLRDGYGKPYRYQSDGQSAQVEASDGNKFAIDQHGSLSGLARPSR